jgi:hypothetical protein
MEEDNYNEILGHETAYDIGDFPEIKVWKGIW